MQLSDFDFHLPDERIALAPVHPRDHARLLHVPRNGPFAHHFMYQLPDLLRPGDIVVVNDSKVIPARLIGKRGMATVELLLHRGMEHGLWEAFAKPAKRLKLGDVIEYGPDFSAKVEAHLGEGLVHVSFSHGDAPFDQHLERYGQMPLPPYIKRNADEKDRASYQTVYAKDPGSVAAPTAGLHFTDELLGKLKTKGIDIARLTLHVGAGTFLPVKVDDIENHVMHPERGEISVETVEQINNARAKGGRVVAVGTTSCRLLETAAESGTLKPWRGETRIFIRPGHIFNAVDVLMTNFHLPRSTLFMLVSAFAGTSRMKAAYAEAIHEGYRFYSYGDGCLLER
jgi:S-adenosylmethionine:tRNA ribosyltransferase-isomerase